MVALVVNSVVISTDLIATLTGVETGSGSKFLVEEKALLAL